MTLTPTVTWLDLRVCTSFNLPSKLKWATFWLYHIGIVVVARTGALDFKLVRDGVWLGVGVGEGPGRTRPTLTVVTPPLEIVTCQRHVTTLTR